MRNIGNCAEEVFYGLLKARRGRKKLLLLSMGELFWKFRVPVANRELYELESPYLVGRGRSFLQFLGRLLLTLFFGGPRIVYHLVHKVRRFLHRFLPVPRYEVQFSFPLIGRSSLWSPAGIKGFSWKIVDEMKWPEQFETPIEVRLSGGKRRWAEKERLRMGVPLHDWFVCLHVREGGFRNDWDHSWRNASIQNYLPAIRLITESGGWVIRMGDPTMTHLPPMDRVIDYAHSPFKGALMDLYLMSACRFFWGTNSGLQEVARLFGKQELLVNLSDWTVSFPLKRESLALLKHVYSRSQNRFFSVKELLEEPLDRVVSQCFRNLHDDWELVENSPDEIRDLVAEFLATPSGGGGSELQAEFKRKRKEQIDRGLPLACLAREARVNAVEQYRFASRVSAARGRLGEKYLEQNWWQDALQQPTQRQSQGM